MILSEKIKLLRKESHLTQEELAEKLDVSRQAITKWETGEGMPDVENLKQISELFDVTIDELVKDAEDVTIKEKEPHGYIEEIEINHGKHFDIHISEARELHIMPNTEEKVKYELFSDQEEPKDAFKIKVDDRFDRMDINIKNKKGMECSKINLYLPEKYIDEIELKSKLKTLGIAGLEFEKLEFDGDLKYLNAEDVKAKIVLNASKCDIEARFNKLEGDLEINTIHSTSRVMLPKGTEYKTIVKGTGNHFMNTSESKDAEHSIELNGIGSKLIVMEH